MSSLLYMEKKKIITKVHVGPYWNIKPQDLHQASMLFTFKWVLQEGHLVQEYCIVVQTGLVLAGLHL